MNPPPNKAMQQTRRLFRVVAVRSFGATSVGRWLMSAAGAAQLSAWTLDGRRSFFRHAA
jgi:hypothetical protein